MDCQTTVNENKNHSQHKYAVAIIATFSRRRDLEL